MGMDFVALLRYKDFYPHVDQMLRLLETDQPIKSIRAIGLLRQKYGWFLPTQTVNWMTKDREIASERPSLPSLIYSLQTSEGFYITVGQDTIRVYNLLRWHSFLQDVVWQSAMLRAVSTLCDLFSAADCIITSDFNPADNAFFKNVTFEEALREAEPDDGEVARISDLYLEKEEDSDVALKPVKNKSGLVEGRVVLWPRTKPLPEGWSRPTVWDSKGYWRFRWQDFNPDL